MIYRALADGIPPGVVLADAAYGTSSDFRASREGTKGPQWSKFAFARVVPDHDDGIDPSVREDVWLIAEWPDGDGIPN